MEQSTTHFSALPSNVFIHPGRAGSAARSSSGDDHRLQRCVLRYCNVANSVKGREPRGQMSSGPGRPMPSPLIVPVPVRTVGCVTVRNPAKSVHTKIHRGTERVGRARSLSLSLFLSFSLSLGRSRPLARHADATVPDLQLTRDAARRVCASLAPAHRILTPLRSWHPRSVSHPPSHPSCLLRSSCQRREGERTVPLFASLFGFLPSFFHPRAAVRPASEPRLFALLVAPRYQPSSLSLSARSPGPPLFLRFS